MHIFEGRPARPSIHLILWLFLVASATAVTLRVSRAVEVVDNLPRASYTTSVSSWLSNTDPKVRALQDVGVQHQQHQPFPFWPSNNRSALRVNKKHQPPAKDPNHQRLSRTFIMQKPFSIIPSAFKGENKLMDYYSNTYFSPGASQGSFPRLRQPQAQTQEPVDTSNYKYHTSDSSQVPFSQFAQPQLQSQPQAQAQNRVDLPSAFTRLMNTYFNLNLPDARNDEQFFVTSTQPPSSSPTPAEDDDPTFPSGQPYIPAYHQQNLATDTPQQDFPSLPAASPPGSLISSDTSSFSCFSNAICTMSVALIMAIGASSILLLPFPAGVGRRRRSLDEKLYPFEVLRKGSVTAPRCPDIMTDPRC